MTKGCPPGALQAVEGLSPPARVPHLEGSGNTHYKHTPGSTDHRRQTSAASNQLQARYLEKPTPNLGNVRPLRKRVMPAGVLGHTACTAGGRAGAEGRGKGRSWIRQGLSRQLHCCPRMPQCGINLPIPA